MHYDFDSFLNEIKYLDRQDIINTVMKRHKSLDKVSSLDKKEGATSLQDKISGLLFFLETGKQSPLLTDDDFAKLKPVCQSLVAKGEMEAKTIELFR